MDLRVKCFNVPGADPALMARVRQAFIEEGFSSVADELSTVLSRHFGNYGIPVEVPGYDPERSDTFADPEGRVLCQVSLETAARLHPSAHTLVVSAVCSAEGGEQRATGILWRCIDQGLAKPGLPEETREVERIGTSLQTLSPNGKLLADPAVGSVLRRLYDVQARRLLKRIVSTFGTEPATTDALLQAVTATGGGRPPKKALAELLQADGLLRESCVIGCARCGERALTFATRQRAERALKEAADPICAFCRQGRLAVLDAYAASEHAAKGLEQGLWLESLVHETLQPESLVALAGRMLEAFELDVACVTYGHVMLIECKDAPFGQNDYVNLVFKAQELRAKVVGIVTTNPLHENVKRLVDAQTQRRQGEWLVADGMEDGTQIATAVLGWVQGLKESYVRRLFSREESSWPDFFELSRSLSDWRS
jgi:hypothetical protein